MPDRHNTAKDSENHERANELESFPTHAHGAADKHGQQDHLRSSELSSRTGLSGDAEYPHFDRSTTGHGVMQFGHSDIAALAHEFWCERGCPEGSPDEDWFRAVKELRSRALAHH